MAKKTTAIEVKAKAELAPWELELMSEARDERSKETLGIPRITHKGGVLKVDEKPVEGNKVKLAIIDFTLAKEYYADSYEEGVAQTPACYAFGKDESTMTPHAAAPEKQADKCAGCKWNAFGTAEKGRGKACKDTRRLLVLHASGVENPEAMAQMEKRQISIPPASLKNWSHYLSSLGDLTRTGNVREGIVEVSTGPNPKGGGHVLTFAFAGPVPSAGLQKIMELKRSSEGALTQPFPALEKQEPKAPARKNRKV
jgi:hypothetical protein